MPFRTDDTYTIPGRGTVNIRDKTYTGKGKGPAGTRKVRAPRSAEVPSVTTASSGQVSSSGFRSQKTARRAERAAAASRRRVRGILRDVARGRQKRSERARERLPELSRTRSRAVRTAPTRPAAPKSAASKPKRFAGKPTAGAPRLGELRRAQSSGRLQVNRKGYVTTPGVRRATGTIKRIEQRAAKRSSAARLPGLDAEQAQVTRTVLRRGERVRATRKEKLAAVETGLVESNMRNLDYGDADSKGFRQERTSLYGDGPAGPTNVKAAADRLYREMRTDVGTATAPTPGLLAQAAQGSAYPERYDERAPQAKAILRAYNRGKLAPGERRKLKRAKAKARKLGLKAEERKQSRKTPTIVRLGKIAERKFDLTVGEHPEFGGVAAGVHDPQGFHPTGEAIDVTGPPSRLRRFNRWVAKRFGGTVAEMFYDPGISLDEGVPVAPIGGHGTHVHVAIDEPGTPAYGLVAAAQGLPASGQPFGYYGAGGSASAAGESAARARRAALTPRQRAQRKFRLLEKLGVGEGIVPGSGEPERDERPSATLSELERRYGV